MVEGIGGLPLITGLAEVWVDVAGVKVEGSGSVRFNIQMLRFGNLGLDFAFDIIDLLRQ